MEKRTLKQIAEGYQTSVKAIETIVDAAESGLLKAWREFIDLEKLIEVNLLIREKDINQVFRRQGFLAIVGDIDNKIDDIIKEVKENE